MEAARALKIDDIIANCRNLFGPLDGECRARLRAVLRNPTEETWEDAYSLIISVNPLSTLWQAWTAIDPTAPRSKPCDGPWPKIPDVVTLRRAILRLC